MAKCLSTCVSLLSYALSSVHQQYINSACRPISCPEYNNHSVVYKPNGLSISTKHTPSDHNWRHRRHFWSGANRLVQGKEVLRFCKSRRSGKQITKGLHKHRPLHLDKDSQIQTFNTQRSPSHTLSCLRPYIRLLSTRKHYQFGLVYHRSSTFLMFLYVGHGQGQSILIMRSANASLWPELRAFQNTLLTQGLRKPSNYATPVCCCVYLSPCMIAHLMFL
jgi:hypothetical protein